MNARYADPGLLGAKAGASSEASSTTSLASIVPTPAKPPLVPTGGRQVHTEHQQALRWASCFPLQVQQGKVPYVSLISYCAGICVCAWRLRGRGHAGASLFRPGHRRSPTGSTQSARLMRPTQCHAHAECSTKEVLDCCAALCFRSVVQLRALQVSARASRMHTRLLGKAVLQGRILRRKACQPPASVAGSMRGQLYR